MKSTHYKGKVIAEVYEDSHPSSTHRDLLGTHDLADLLWTPEYSGGREKKSYKGVGPQWVQDALVILEMIRPLVQEGMTRFQIGAKSTARIMGVDERRVKRAINGLKRFGFLFEHEVQKGHRKSFRLDASLYREVKRVYRTVDDVRAAVANKYGMGLNGMGMLAHVLLTLRAESGKRVTAAALVKGLAEKGLIL